MEKSSLKIKILSVCVLATVMSACNKVDFKPVLADNTPSGVVPDPTPAPSKSVSKTEVVAYGNKQVDFLLVLDDSNSMLPELKKLSARLATFVSSLEASDIDWQMCLTTTRGYASGTGIVHGPNLLWRNYVPVAGTPAYLLKRGTANLNNIFTTTIDNLTIGGTNSGDERGIKATHDHFVNSALHQCYRKGAAISVILISDEDERSVGGDQNHVKSNDATNTYQPLELEDLPDTLLSRSRTTFGDDVRFTFSSIIVKPEDVACEAEQDKDTSPSHFGHIYAQASKLTDGGIGSICDADYSANLNTFKDKIVNSLSNLTLDCEADPASLQVKVGGLLVPGLKLDGKILKFEYPLIEGTKIDLKYNCLD